MRCAHDAESDPLPETPRPAHEPSPWRDTSVVGRRLPKVDAYERVSGSAVYPTDVVLPGMLYGAVLCSPHANALVRGVDIAAAEDMPGVHAVLCGATPEADLYWPYTWRVRSKLFAPHCRHEGEAVAAVAAETPYQARDALLAIAVDYEVLPALSDPRRALEPGAVAVYPDGNLALEPQVYERGDVDQGFAEADVVLEREYRTASGLHAAMEPHGCVARWEGRRLTLWESTQGVYQVQRYVAHVLGLSLANLRVIGHYVGGGFGAKLWPDKYTIIAALLAQRTGRPVKLFLSREQTFLCVGNRSSIEMRLKAGARSDGTLTALDFSCLGTCGAYLNFPTNLVDWLVRDLYLCPNVRTERTTVYVHGGRPRPFRAPGYPQGAWALEQMMDELAEALDMDPVELRLRNVPTFSQAHGGRPYTTTGLRQCLCDGAEELGWREGRGRPAGAGPVRRGVGVAAGLMVEGGGGPPSTVILQLFADGSVSLNLGASDIGTGTKTVMAMVVAEELGVDPYAVRIEHADTATTQYATPSGGSKTVATEAPAVRDAALEVKRQLLEMAAEELGSSACELTFSGGAVVAPGEPATRLGVTELAELGRRGSVVGVGYRGPNPEGKVVHPFAAHFCEVEVDTRTGTVTVLRYVAVHDSGRVMNRLGFDNQVFGGVIMGAGMALTEARLLDRNQTGKLVTHNWHDYKIPTALDVPREIVSLPVDRPDDEANSVGAKGLGEIVVVPVAPAIANAVYHATGVRVRESPISPVLLLRLLDERREPSEAAKTTS